MTSRTNSNDVARLAGVSRSTVSRVFTDGAYASAETSERVRKAADQLGYSPNAIARSLSMNRTGLIGVIVGELDNPFYADILQVIGEKLQQRRLASLLFVANPSAMDTLIPQVLSYRVDGVIISGAILSSKMALRCQSAGIPVVLVNRYTDSDLISSVVGDNVGGAGQGHGVDDGLATVLYHRDVIALRDAGEDLREDQRRRFVARVVAGQHHLVGQPGGDGTHQRTLGGVAVAAAAEGAPQAAAAGPGQRAQRQQHLLQGVGRVRVVDHHLRHAFARAHALHPARDRREQRRDAAGVAQRDAQAGGDHRLLDLLPGNQFAAQNQAHHLGLHKAGE